MKRTAYLIFVAFLMTTFIHAQGNFQNGYILTLKNDTVYGQLENRSNVLNYTTCHFKKDTKVIEYKASEINGFGYDKAKCFTAGIVEGSFVEVLVGGYMQLYKYQSVYYIKKGSEAPIKLQSVMNERNIDDENFFVPDRKWQGLLAYAIYDCFPNSPNMVERLKLIDLDLYKIVLKYNQCKNPNLVVVSTNKKAWSKMHFGVSYGFEHSILRKSDILHWFQYVSPKYSTTEPTIGLVMGFSSPRFSERLSFQPEIYLTNVHYSGFVPATNTNFNYTTKMSWTTFSLPLAFRYSIPFGKNAAYVQAGIIQDIMTKAKTSCLKEEIINGVNTKYPETIVFKTTEYAYGICGGFGVKRDFKHFQVGLACRYNRMSSITLNEMIDMYPERLSFCLQILTN